MTGALFFSDQIGGQIDFGRPFIIRFLYRWDITCLMFREYYGFNVLGIYSFISSPGPEVIEFFSCSIS